MMMPRVSRSLTRRTESTVFFGAWCVFFSAASVCGGKGFIKTSAAQSKNGNGQGQDNPWRRRTYDNTMIPLSCLPPPIALQRVHVLWFRFRTHRFGFGYRAGR